MVFLNLNWGNDTKSDVDYCFVQLSKLCRQLDSIWEEIGPGVVIIYEWVQFLKEHALESLSISSPFTPQRLRRHKWKTRRTADTRAYQDVASYSKLIAAIVDYDNQEREVAFNNSFFTCAVCFSEKPGTLCISFHGCHHVYCQDCMAGYFKVKIEDGSVKALTCPSHDCNTQALPSQVKQLVTPELFTKYDKFLLQSSLDGMSDIVYCPRPSCQMPVLIEKESSMGVCPGCTFAFCIFCRLGYHGLAPCKLVKPDEIRKIRDEYSTASDEEKIFMEKRYGKKQLKHIFEDLFTAEWLESNAKQCPNCSTSIQKVDGCNKMTCTKCRCYFCWMCFSILSRSNPYLHFNNPASKCFNRLFEGIARDNEFDEDDEEEDEDDWLLVVEHL